MMRSPNNTMRIAATGAAKSLNSADFADFGLCDSIQHLRQVLGFLFANKTLSGRTGAS